MHQYYSVHAMAVKPFWINKPLITIFKTYFKSRPLEYCTNAINQSAILINGKKTTPNHILKPSDIITHLIHIHEPIIDKISVIKQTKDILAVNKPFGIACHPTGCYYYASATVFLNQTTCINRLDVPTTGVLLLALNNAKNYHLLLKNKEVHKEYLALVVGKFTNTVVDSKLSSKNVVVVDCNGKDAVTEFFVVHYDGICSLIKCVPKTGRQHQIRVHLQSIGFPIVNDILYGKGLTYYDIYPEDKSECIEDNNSDNNVKCEKLQNEEENTEINECRENFDANSKKVKVEEKMDAEKKEIFRDKPVNERIPVVCRAHIMNRGSIFVCDGKVNVDKPLYSDKVKRMLGKHFKENIYGSNPEAYDFARKNCETTNSRPCINKNKFICLHAYKYKIDGEEFVADPPFWAKKHLENKEL